MKSRWRKITRRILRVLDRVFKNAIGKQLLHVLVAKQENVATKWNRIGLTLAQVRRHHLESDVPFVGGFLIRVVPLTRMQPLKSEQLALTESGDVIDAI